MTEAKRLTIPMMRVLGNLVAGDEIFSQVVASRQHFRRAPSPWVLEELQDHGGRSPGLERSDEVVKLTIEDKWMGDGTAYEWSVTEDEAFASGIAGDIGEAASMAVNTVLGWRCWPGRTAVAVVPHGVVPVGIIDCDCFDHPATDEPTEPKENPQ